jgi:uncharacterized protein
MKGAALELERIEIFPIKSLDAVRVSEAAITAGGILENDRVYAIVDLEGRFVNGKRTEQIHRLRCSFDDEIREVWLRHEGEASPTRFELGEPARLERWLSDFFGFPVELRHESTKGFPDDNEAFGPTVGSLASLLHVQAFYGLSLDSVRRRFRTNLELGGNEAFSEDRLFGGPDERKPFRIGVVNFLGHNPCQRCVVPTRDPENGAVIHGFQKAFTKFRESSLPAWSDSRRFNHFYRFAVNTSILPSEVGKRIRVGDTLAFD